MHRILVVLVSLLGFTMVSGGWEPTLPPIPARSEAEADDEKLLKDNKVPTDGPALLVFVRKRFTEVVSDDRLGELIVQLGDDSFARREEASRQLVLVGAQARKHLQAAVRHADLEIRYRAEACLKELARDDDQPRQVNAAAVRRAGPAQASRNDRRTVRLATAHRRRRAGQRGPCGAGGDGDDRRQA